MTNTQLRQDLFASIRGFSRLSPEEKPLELGFIEGLRDTLRGREHDPALSPLVREIAGRYADQADIPICNFRLELDLPVS